MTKEEQFACLEQQTHHLQKVIGQHPEKFIITDDHPDWMTHFAQNALSIRTVAACLLAVTEVLKEVYRDV